MKKLISILLFSAISVNSYAFKIISQEFTHSPGAKAYFDSHAYLVPATNTTLTPKYAQATVETENRYALQHENIRPLMSFHEVILSNTSSTLKTYYYHYLLKCNGDFAEFKQTISLEPNERRVETEHMFLTFLPEVIGKFPIEALTEVSGAEKAIESMQKSISVLDN